MSRKLMPWMVLLLVAAGASGCQSGRLGPYTSPRVVGRVVDAQSQRPLPGVRVLRGKPAKERPTGGELKGGQLLMEKAPVRTDETGRFALASERVLTLFRGTGWNSVRLTFEHPGYERFQTNLSLTTSGNGAGSEPVLDAGQIQLRRLGR